MIRLFVTTDLSQHQNVSLSKEQAHYLANVMRRKEGQEVLLFNGKDGEWKATITLLTKRNAELLLNEQIKPQQPEPKLRLCFAPVKNAPLHFLVQKATELGASELQPIITRHTVVSRVNTEKLKANVLEAAEQCGRLTVPAVQEPITFKQFLEQKEKASHIIFCDETGGGESALKTLSSLPVDCFPTILIGPEGGFSADEVKQLHADEHTVAIGLGPRILRADTAALAALTVVQAAIGDWDKQPKFNAEEA